MMRVLLICDASIEKGVLNIASWIQSLLETSSGYEYSILTTAHPTIEVYNLAGKTIKLYPLSFDSKEFFEQFNNISPDVAIVFGTEHDYSLPAMKLLQKCGFISHTILYAQGFSSECAKHYTEGLPQYVINRTTFRDIVRRDPIWIQVRKFQKSAKKENEAMELCENFIGRTSLDKKLLSNANIQASYYRCNDIMRDVFYTDEWKYTSCNKHSIFVSQYYYPLKGFHYLLRAVAELKEKYPDILITASGYNPIREHKTAATYRDSSYIRYIKHLLKEHRLENNVKFVGFLSAEEMKEQYLKANVFVMPSTVENSPNSMAEAMLLGAPSVLADVGGVKDYAIHNYETFIYPSSDEKALANYIDYVFSQEEKIETVSCCARKRAFEEYDKERNIARFENILQEVSKK